MQNIYFMIPVDLKILIKVYLLSDSMMCSNYINTVYFNKL